MGGVFSNDVICGPSKNSLRVQNQNRGSITAWRLSFVSHSDHTVTMLLKYDMYERSTFPLIVPAILSESPRGVLFSF
jgi:hypothetical protein